MSDQSKSASQQEADNFHMMLGYCIVAWADVDEILFRIFRDCLGPYEQSAIIYYRTPGLDVRFKLTDEIVKSLFPKKKPGEHNHQSILAWQKAIKGHGDLLGVRRRLAHHPTQVRMNILEGGAFNTAPFNAEVTAFSWVESYVGDHEKMRGQAGSEKPPLRFKDLEDHHEAVGAMADRPIALPNRRAVKAARMIRSA